MDCATARDHVVRFFTHALAPLTVWTVWTVFTVLIVLTESRPVPKLRRGKATRIQEVWSGAGGLAEDDGGRRRCLVSRNREEPTGAMLPPQFLAPWFPVWLGPVVRRDRIGGLLHFYYRRADASGQAE